jgi:hypothetical protein
VERKFGIHDEDDYHTQHMQHPDGRIARLKWAQHPDGTKSVTEHREDSTGGAGKQMAKAILFPAPEDRHALLKSHIETYTKKSGSVVVAHDDKRSAAHPVDHATAVAHAQGRRDAAFDLGKKAKEAKSKEGYTAAEKAHREASSLISKLAAALLANNDLGSPEDYERLEDFASKHQSYANWHLARAAESPKAADLAAEQAKAPAAAEVGKNQPAAFNFSEHVSGLNKVRQGRNASLDAMAEKAKAKNQPA